MSLSREDRLAIAKMALEHLAALETNNAHHYTAVIARQAGVSTESATFEQMFNVVFNSVVAKVDVTNKPSGVTS